MTGFEPQTCGVRSDHSTNSATLQPQDWGCLQRNNKGLRLLNSAIINDHFKYVPKMAILYSPILKDHQCIRHQSN